MNKINNLEFKKLGKKLRESCKKELTWTRIGDIKRKKLQKEPI